MRTLLLLGLLAAAGCGPDEPPVAVEGIDPVESDGDLTPDVGLAPDADRAPDSALAPPLGSDSLDV